jgi:hypothetical protein
MFPTMLPVIPTLMSYCKMPHLTATAMALASAEAQAQAAAAVGGEASGACVCAAPQQVSVHLCTVTFYANLAHSLTRSP